MTEQNIARSRTALMREAFRAKREAGDPTAGMEPTRAEQAFAEVLAPGKAGSRQPLADLDGEDLTRRAFAAYFRSGGTDQPSNTSGLVEHEGKAYVVLHNVNGVLAVYRVRTSGVLKALRRWPEALNSSL